MIELEKRVRTTREDYAKVAVVFLDNIDTAENASEIIKLMMDIPTVSDGNAKKYLSRLITIHNGEPETRMTPQSLRDAYYAEFELRFPEPVEEEVEPTVTEVHRTFKDRFDDLTSQFDALFLEMNKQCNKKSYTI